MDVRYVSQDRAHLRFALYNQRLPREGFRIFCERRIRTESYDAELWIIGTSHVVSVETRGSVVCEVLTCAPDGLPNEGRVRLLDALTEGQCEDHVDEAISYSADLTTTVHTERVYQEQHALLCEGDPPHRLRYTFPQHDGTVAPPLTVIDVVRCEDDLFELRTAHSYPQDLSIVRTHSTIRIAHSGQAV